MTCDTQSLSTWVPHHQLTEDLTDVVETNTQIKPFLDSCSMSK